MAHFNTKFLTCKPLVSLNDILNWSPSLAAADDDVNCRKFSVEKLKKSYHKDRPANNKIIVCHDMRNNYLEDRYMQGYIVSNGYRFIHWNLIDYFIYFSHNLITIPPESWTNAAHENNVKMLGTFITEFDDGKAICKQLLGDRALLDKLVLKMVDLTVYYGFDGWLINIENKVENVENLMYFLTKLKRLLYEIDSSLYKVIWYDSVIENGDLVWQNELNNLNECFFACADQLFLNYTWKDENLQRTKANGAALERLGDIYTGVDVFGRGCFGGGGFNTCKAFEKIQTYSLNYALFAPAWVYECNDPAEFLSNNELFWQLIGKFLNNNNNKINSNKREIIELPIVTTFANGCGEKFFLDGKEQTTWSGWFNLNLQSLLPILFEYDGENLIVNANWCTDDAFYAGNCILINNQSVNLFKLNIQLFNEDLIQIDYVFKFAAEAKNDEIDTDLIKFCITLKYESSNQLESIDLNNGDENSFIKKPIEIVDFKQLKLNAANWYLKSFKLRVTTAAAVAAELRIRELNCRFIGGGCGPIKLGYLRMMNLSNDFSPPLTVAPLPINPEPKIDYQTRIFQLKNEIYLTIELQWRIFPDEDEKNCNKKPKYYNLFLNRFAKTKLNQKAHDHHHHHRLVYVGSTRVNKFSSCFKLHLADDRVRFDKFKLNDSIDLNIEPINQYEPLRFDVHLQIVDELFECLINKNTTERTMPKIEVIVPLVQVQMRSDRQDEPVQFLEEIIADFEYFKV